MYRVIVTHKRSNDVWLDKLTSSEQLAIDTGESFQDLLIDGETDYSLTMIDCSTVIPLSGKSIDLFNMKRN